MKSKEGSLQSACVRWFRYRFPKYSLLLFAVPNGGSRNVIEAANLKQQGVVAGVSDLILLVPRQGHSSLCIEMKYGKGKQTELQTKWQQQAEKEGNKYVICRTVDEFIMQVEAYLCPKQLP